MILFSTLGACYGAYRQHWEMSLALGTIAFLLNWVMALKDRLIFQQRNEIIAQEIIETLVEDLKVYRPEADVKKLCDRAVRRGHEQFRVENEGM